MKILNKLTKNWFVLPLLIALIALLVFLNTPRSTDKDFATVHKVDTGHSEIGGRK